MIPSIEDIFKMLIEGVISFDQAESWVRSHVAASEDTQMLRPVFAGLAMNGLLASGLYNGQVDAKELTKPSVTLADALLQELAK